MTAVGKRSDFGITESGHILEFNQRYFRMPDFKPGAKIRIRDIEKER